MVWVVTGICAPVRISNYQWAELLNDEHFLIQTALKTAVVLAGF
jgi:hypothetical protein